MKPNDYSINLSKTFNQLPQFFLKFFRYSFLKKDIYLAFLPIVFKLLKWQHVLAVIPTFYDGLHQVFVLVEDNIKPKLHFGVNGLLIFNLE